VITYRPRSASVTWARRSAIPGRRRGLGGGGGPGNAARSPKRSATPRPRRRGAAPSWPSSPPRCSTAPGTSGSTRRAWCSATGGGRGVPGRVGRMPGRTVLQWDKDDCAAIGLVKFDLLASGCSRRSTAASTSWPSTTGHRRPGPAAQESQVYDLFCRRTPSGSSRSRAGRRWHAAPGAATLLLRPRDRGRPHPARAHPGPGRHPTSAPARLEPVTYLHPSWSRYSAGRSGCRCSKSS